MDCRIGLKQMIKEQFQVDSVITSPPYYSQRDYNIPPIIWDGDPKCKHKWDIEMKTKQSGGDISKYWKTGGIKDFQLGEKSQGNFCLKCNAWLGSLGSEPDITLYIKHLCDIYDLVWQVLKPIGTNWVNLGDSYSSGGRSGSKEYAKTHTQFGKTYPQEKYQAPKKVDGFSSKCLLMIPQRFAIEMINRGWVLRNEIIWNKPNSMPESCKDRFTIDFEYLFFFVKNVKPLYWINSKTAKLVSKKPLGTKGIENEDWRWIECEKCLGTGITHHKCKFCKGEGYYYDKFLRPKICPKCKGAKRIRENSKCNKCKGLGKVKKSYWNSRGYFFEQQREPQSPNTHSKGKNPKTTEILKNKSKQINGKISHKNWLEYTKETFLPLGRNKRCVWEIPTVPHSESHFAVFSEELIETPIKAGCPEYVCEKCGFPREKIIKRTVPKMGIDLPICNNETKIAKVNKLSPNSVLRIKGGDNYLKWKYQNPDKLLGYSDYGCYDNIKYSKSGLNLSPTSTILTKKVIPKKIIGLSNCNHNSKWKLGIVLDPFAGIGTTLLTAWKLGRNFIGFEISKKYCEIANKKLDICKNKRLDDFIFPEIENKNPTLMDYIEV